MSTLPNNMSWLFVKDHTSVFITRRQGSDGYCRLSVQGPGNAARLEAFEDAVLCVEAQVALERRLVDEGFRLEAADRRRARAPRPPEGFERRRGDADGLPALGAVGRQ